MHVSDICPKNVTNCCVSLPHVSNCFATVMSVTSCAIGSIFNKCMFKSWPLNVTSRLWFHVYHVTCNVICNKWMCCKICPKNVTNRCVSWYQVYHSCAILIRNRCLRLMSILPVQCHIYWIHVLEICPKNVTKCCATEHDVYHLIWMSFCRTNACVSRFAPKMWPIVVHLCIRCIIQLQYLSYITNALVGNLPQKCDQLLCVFVSGLSFLCNITYNKCRCQKFAPKMWPTVVRLSMMSIILLYSHLI